MAGVPSACARARAPDDHARVYGTTKWSAAVTHASKSSSLWNSSIIVTPLGLLGEHAELRRVGEIRRRASRTDPDDHESARTSDRANAWIGAIEPFPRMEEAGTEE